MESKYDLSILIPARNEMFLAQTVRNILENIRGKTEIIVVLDGAWADPPLPDDPRLTVVYHNESVGQRAATNDACKLSNARWVMKCDAHVAFDEGFDVKMMQEMEGHDDWTMMPRLYNLHVFDWKCKKCGNQWYQGPTPTFCHINQDEKNPNPNCDSTQFERVIIWKPRLNRRSDFMRFDNDLHFQYFGEYGKREESKGDIADSMSLLGACFMLTRERYWDLNICDEEYGSWGGQGTEVACKSWLSGGALKVNKKTWYSHLFRTQGGDFGFPYPQSNKQVEHARQMNRDYWFKNSWDKQTRPLRWLVEKFWPVPGWTQEDLDKLPKHLPNLAKIPQKSLQNPTEIHTKGIIYYTPNDLNLKIAHKVQKQLESIGLPIVSASLKPMTFGKNVCIKKKKGYMAMFKQILAALEAQDTDIVYFCEHDVLYDPSHFEFTPPKKDVWYYNVNVWKLDANTSHAIRVDECKQVSGICVYRETAVKHYRKRVEMLEKYLSELNKDVEDIELNTTMGEQLISKFNSYVRAMGFEPGTHNRAERVDDATSETYSSNNPNVDIRHDNNLTSTRWNPEQFRNKKFTEGWTESDTIPHWGKIKLS